MKTFTLKNKYYTYSGKMFRSNTQTEILYDLIFDGGYLVNHTFKRFVKISYKLLRSI